MIQQANAWNQFWFDLASGHRVFACTIFDADQDRRWMSVPPGGRYRCLWYRMTDLGPIYHRIEGETFWELLRNGLDRFDANTVRMKLSLLALLTERIAQQVEAL